VFDIDGMSSGEKGLILTFLIISYSLAEGGIVLIDEPELHLNPAVCKILLPFLIDHYLVPKGIQAIICTHSPELLSAAFDRKDCSLHHLQGPTVISKIYPEDKREVFDALKRLGTSASDVLFSNGSIFVEGEHDIEVLETGFSKRLGRFNIARLGGRGPVEQEIQTLQSAERKKEIDTLQCFIFDLDRSPTQLKSTKLIRVLQWRRRCLENYLIEDKIIYDLLKEKDISKKSLESRGEVSATFKKIAMSQLQGQVILDIYNRLGYELPRLRAKDIFGRGYDDIASELFTNLEGLQSKIAGIEKMKWIASFVNACQDEFKNVSPRWEYDWMALCDGKRFIADIHSQFELQISHLSFKKRIIERMEYEKSDGWKQLDALLSEALQ
jgi:hypothetical protein